MFRLTLVFIFSLFFASAQSQPGSETKMYFFGDEELAPHVSKGFQHLYSFEFLQADSLIKQLLVKYPNHYSVNLLASNYYWWHLVSGIDNDTCREKFRKYLDRSCDIKTKVKPDKLDDSDMFRMIIYYAFRARLELLTFSYVKAVFYLGDCLHYLKKSFGRESRYHYFNLTSGLYNYFIEYSLRHYPILYPYLIFAPKGDMKKGIAQLELAANSQDVFLRNEGRYFLLKIYLEMEPEPIKAVSYAKQITDKHPENLLYQYLLFKALIISDNMGEVKKQLERINYYSIINKSLKPEQRSFFPKQAQEDLKKYYSGK